jgi:nitrile hydratase
MNTIHDLGGMDGLTLPERDQGFPLHEQWERQVWGLVMSRRIPGYRSGGRAALERMPPDQYLSLPYYAKWLWREETAMVRAGIVTESELADPDGPLTMPNLPDFTPAGPAEIIASLAADDSDELEAEVAPRYSVGDEVMVRNQHPTGHTRVPRYTRGHRGVIHTHHGVHILLDDFPNGEDPGQQHLYTVMFTGEELWGDRANVNDRICAELWEFHLEPAAEECA